MRIGYFAVDRGNPYHERLYSGLGELGIDVVSISAHQGRWPDRKIFPIWSAVRSERLSILHLHWLHQYFRGSRTRAILGGFRLLLDLLLVRAAGIRIVWTVHNVCGHEAEHPEVEKAFYHLVCRICSAILLHCPDVVPIIQSEYNLPDRLVDRIAVVHHGNYVGAYPQACTRTEARSHLGLPEEAFVVLFFGSLRPYKGVEKLIQTVRMMAHPDLHLFIAGRSNSDEYSNRLNRAADGLPCVSVVDRFIPADEVQWYFGAADVVALPFRDITTSGSALLAMSFGCPIVAPRVGCVAQLLTDSPLGYSDSDPNGLVNALQKSASLGAEELKDLGLQAREIAESFGWTEASLKTLEVYRRVMQSP